MRTKVENNEHFKRLGPYDAELYLKGKPKGTYVLRPSRMGPDYFVLSLVDGEQNIVHIRLAPAEPGSSQVVIKYTNHPNDFKCGTLEELLSHLQDKLKEAKITMNFNF